TEAFPGFPEEALTRICWFAGGAVVAVLHVNRTCGEPHRHQFWPVTYQYGMYFTYGLAGIRPTTLRVPYVICPPVKWLDTSSEPSPPAKYHPAPSENDTAPESTAIFPLDTLVSAWGLNACWPALPCSTPIHDTS